MTNYKQIKSNFWQSDFVLGLSPSEKYFYLYLITNSMTNLCGIYKFNLKLAELETGYSAESIQEHLYSLEEYGKIRISKSSKEIMIVNWFKHNFKNNKTTKLSIRKELREVKDKEFLKLIYEICQDKDYPVEDLFKGLKLTEVEEEELQSCEAIEEAGEDKEESEGICVATWSFGENRGDLLDNVASRVPYNKLLVNDENKADSCKFIRIPTIKSPIKQCLGLDSYHPSG